MFRKELVIGIICLFIGVGIQPAFAIENSSINRTSSEDIEDCNCKVADNYDIVRVEKLLNRAERSLNRVETLTKLIPILSKDNPEVIEDCEELSEKINTFREMKKEFDLNPPPIICGLLYVIIKIIMNLINFFESLYEKFYNYPILREFFNIFFILFIVKWGTIWIIMMLFNCPQTPV